MPLEQHYTTAEVAKALNCSADTVLRLAQRGELKSVFVGRERRYPQSAIDAYLARSAAPTVNAAVVPIAQRRA